jgi:hypothetical protein
VLSSVPQAAAPVGRRLILDETDHSLICLSCRRRQRKSKETKVLVVPFKLVNIEQLR